MERFKFCFLIFFMIDNESSMVRIVKEHGQVSMFASCSIDKLITNMSDDIQLSY